MPACAESGVRAPGHGRSLTNGVTARGDDADGDADGAWDGDDAVSNEHGSWDGDGDGYIRWKPVIRRGL